MRATSKSSLEVVGFVVSTAGIFFVFAAIYGWIDPSTIEKSKDRMVENVKELDKELEKLDLDDKVQRAIVISARKQFIATESTRDFLASIALFSLGTNLLLIGGFVILLRRIKSCQIPQAGGGSTGP